MITHRKIFCVLAIIILFTSICGCGANEEAVPTFTELPEEVVIDETISIIALGDNLMHMPVVNSGKQADGTYDYTHIFKNLQPKIKNADIAVTGQETVFGGEKFGYSGYPLFNSPSDLGKTLVSEGFDVVLHASNHVVDKGAEGIENTLAFWKNYPEITVLGINESPEAKQAVKIINVKGADIALLNYTYGTNGISLPAGKEYLVNYIDNDKIMADAAYAEENADFTVAFMHWGTEYSAKPDIAQKELAQNMCQWGVDLIIGSHPHVVEPVERITAENGNTMVVYYSLGNFVSRQLYAENLVGGMADVKLHYDGENVEISDYSFVPVVTHYNTSFTDYSVYPIYEYTDELAAKHAMLSYGKSVNAEKWRGIIERTFEGYDISIVDMGGDPDAVGQNAG